MTAEFSTICPQCGSCETVCDSCIIDRVSGRPMPGPVSIAGSVPLMGMGLFLMSEAIPGGFSVELLLLIAGAIMFMVAVRVGWLLLFGEPVTLYRAHCPQCDITWQEREDRMRSWA